jgi:hypothetical protein
MDYQGRSLNEGGVDPALLATVVELESQVGILQGEVKTLESEVKTLEQTVITLGYTDQLCVVQAQVATLPTSPINPSFAIEQQVALVGLNPPLYDSYGYAPDARVALNAFNSLPNLYVLASSVNVNNIIGVRFEPTSDQPDARFHVTGTATLELPLVNVDIALRVRYTYFGGLVQTVDFNRTRLPFRSPENPRVEYKFDEYVYVALTTFDAQYVDFYVVVIYNFGTTPMVTNTLTGGWDTQYENYIRVQRVK